MIIIKEIIIIYKAEIMIIQVIIEVILLVILILSIADDFKNNKK